MKGWWNMSNPLTKKDLPEIKTAVIKFRDDLKKHLKDGKPIGNFTGNVALEKALREPPRGLCPEQAVNLYLANDLSPDLVQALASLWQKCWRYGTPDERFELQRAIDEVLRIIEELDDTQTRTKAVWRGTNTVQIGDEINALEPQDAAVLGALVKLGAAMTPQLVKESGYGDPVSVLRKLPKKFPALKPYIEFPGGRGKGRYKTTITRHRTGQLRCDEVSVRFQQKAKHAMIGACPQPLALNADTTIVFENLFKRPVTSSSLSGMACPGQRHVAGSSRQPPRWCLWTSWNWTQFDFSTK